jgi:hypothetical protein
MLWDKLTFWTEALVHSLCIKGQKVFFKVWDLQLSKVSDFYVDFKNIYVEFAQTIDNILRRLQLRPFLLSLYYFPHVELVAPPFYCEGKRGELQALVSILALSQRYLRNNNKSVLYGWLCIALNSCALITFRFNRGELRSRLALQNCSFREQVYFSNIFLEIFVDTHYGYTGQRHKYELLKKSTMQTNTFPNLRPNP